MKTGGRRPPAPATLGKAIPPDHAPTRPAHPGSGSRRPAPRTPLSGPQRAGAGAGAGADAFGRLAPPWAARRGRGDGAREGRGHAAGPGHGRRRCRGEERGRRAGGGCGRARGGRGAWARGGGAARAGGGAEPEGGPAPTRRRCASGRGRAEAPGVRAALRPARFVRARARAGAVRRGACGAEPEEDRPPPASPRALAEPRGSRGGQKGKWGDSANFAARARPSAAGASRRPADLPLCSE